MIVLSRDQLFSEVKRGFRFLAVGAVGLAVDSTVFMLLFNQHSPRPVARAASLVAATLVTWFANRAVTFGASGRSRRAELGRYGLVALVAQGFNYGLFLALSAAAPKIHPLPLIVVSAASAAMFSYAGQRLFTFGASRTPAT